MYEKHCCSFLAGRGPPLAARRSFCFCRLEIQLLQLQQLSFNKKERYGCLAAFM
jgi:hypothetical protein